MRRIQELSKFCTTAKPEAIQSSISYMQVIFSKQIIKLSIFLWDLLKRHSLSECVYSLPGHTESKFMKFGSQFIQAKYEPTIKNTYLQRAAELPQRRRIHADKLLASKHTDALYSCSVLCLPPESMRFWEGLNLKSANQSHCSKATIPFKALILTSSHSDISNIFPAILIVTQQAGTIRVSVSLRTLGCTMSMLQQAEIFCCEYYTLGKT